MTSRWIQTLLLLAPLFVGCVSTTDEGLEDTESYTQALAGRPRTADDERRVEDAWRRNIAKGFAKLVGAYDGYTVMAVGGYHVTVTWVAPFTQSVVYPTLIFIGPKPEKGGGRTIVIARAKIEAEEMQKIEAKIRARLDKLGVQATFKLEKQSLEKVELQLLKVHVPEGVSDEAFEAYLKALLETETFKDAKAYGPGETPGTTFEHTP